MPRAGADARRPPPAVPVPARPRRFSMLENQCLTWPDAISAAVYLPLLSYNPPKRRKAAYWDALANATADDAIDGMAAFFAVQERAGACALTLQLIGHLQHPRRPEPYPINALRNRALAAAATDLVLVLDVDFMAAPGLGLPPPGYRHPAAYDRLLGLVEEERVALVLPAFEITRRRQELVLGQSLARSMVMGE